MLSSAFYSVLPSIGTCRTVGAYTNAKLFHLTELPYRIVTLSAWVASKATYGYVIV